MPRIVWWPPSSLWQLYLSNFLVVYLCYQWPGEGDDCGQGCTMSVTYYLSTILSMWLTLCYCNLLSQAMVVHYYYYYFHFGIRNECFLNISFEILSNTSVQEQKWKIAQVRSHLLNISASDKYIGCRKFVWHLSKLSLGQWFPKHFAAET